MSDFMVHGVLITFRRPADLEQTLGSLAGQSRSLDTLIIIDNDGDPLVNEIVSRSERVARHVEYIPAAENLGPAGGLALGCELLLRMAKNADWVMFFDDDNPPRTANGISEIVRFAEDSLRRDPSTGGVGLVGTRFELGKGMTVRLADEELSGPVAVSYIGGGQLPCYRVAAIRQVGLPRPELFFGFDDLEYGLRITGSGLRLYVDGDKLARERRAYDIFGTDKSPRMRLTTVGWRDYYSTRNLIWILRSRHYHVAAMQVVARRVAKAVYNSLRRPRIALTYFAFGIRATFDAYTGRMGRTIEPVPEHTTARID